MPHRGARSAQNSESKNNSAFSARGRGALRASHDSRAAHREIGRNNASCIGQLVRPERQLPRSSISQNEPTVLGNVHECSEMFSAMQNEQNEPTALANVQECSEIFSAKPNTQNEPNAARPRQSSIILTY